ncbi:MAG TPA: DUF6396 domain-containing protein [Burkholderiaceae bacterium]|nr:DUF6396 domain-containing protein [Burkholderiaceae bacterium]
MRPSILKWSALGGLLALASGGIFLYGRHLEYKAMHTMPSGLYVFKLTDPLPICDNWKRHMPTYRDPEVYRPYIAARKLWRSKIEWQLTRTEIHRILDDVTAAANKGDWGARALLSHFYRYGLGPLPSNNVLEPNADKHVELARQAVAAGQPWGFYDLGVAHEYGYGGAAYDEEIAWAYYYRAAQLGSPEGQMALSQAYAKAERPMDEKYMLQCAYRQGHGPAAVQLGMIAEIENRYQDAIRIYQEGTKFGNSECASSLYLLFSRGHWTSATEEQKQALLALGVTKDEERTKRYLTIADALEINPDLRLGRLDIALPLPPAKLPTWRGIQDAMDVEPSGAPAY